MNLIVKLIRIYQNTPLKSHSKCRFYPTCSEYTIIAIEEYGTIKGLYLGLKRIIRCNPFNKKFGYDPVPLRRKNEKD